MDASTDIDHGTRWGPDFRPAWRRALATKASTRSYTRPIGRHGLLPHRVLEQA